MSDIELLQGRIMAALDRIGQGLDTLARTPDEADTEEIDTLRQSLEEERLANAQLEERVKQLGARTRAAEEAAQANSSAADQDRARHAEALRRTDAELQALRKANQQLRDSNAALREANATGVIEPHLINKAMMAELEALRASRATDRAEVELLLSELDGIVAAAGGDEAAADTGAEDAPSDDAASADSRQDDGHHKEDV